VLCFCTRAKFCRESVFTASSCSHGCTGEAVGSSLSGCSGKASELKASSTLSGDTTWRSKRQAPIAYLKAYFCHLAVQKAERTLCLVGQFMSWRSSPNNFKCWGIFLEIEAIYFVKIFFYSISIILFLSQSLVIVQQSLLWLEILSSFVSSSSLLPPAEAPHTSLHVTSNRVS
jgi:hypothetical protein